MPLHDNGVHDFKAVVVPLAWCVPKNVDTRCSSAQERSFNATCVPLNDTASTNGAAARWSAVADECPGVLAVSFKGTHVALNDRSCALEHLVSTFFGTHQAKGTTTALKSCTPLS